MPTEQVICSAYQGNREGNSGLDITLTPTGEHAYSITTTIKLALDDHGGLFFLKPIVPHQDREPSQLIYLNSVGIPVPNPVFIHQSSSWIATPFSGDMLSIVIVSLEQNEAERLIFQIGVLLKKVHQSLEQTPPAEDVVTKTYYPTAHIVDNFYYKHIGVISETQYANFKDNKLANGKGGKATKDYLEDKPFIPTSGCGETEFRRLMGFANELAGSFLDKLKPFIAVTTQEGLPKPFLNFMDTQLFEGDYKPDNLLVTKRGTDWGITIIDPAISRGTTRFDLAKFTGRFLLEGYSTYDQDLLLRFFEGYGYKPVAGKLEYGPLSFTDLVRMDILNILRSYAKRFIQGDKKYHLVSSLGSDEFCLRTRHLLEGMN